MGVGHSEVDPHLPGITPAQRLPIPLRFVCGLYQDAPPDGGNPRFETQQLHTRGVSFGKQTRVTFPKRRRSQFEIRPTWAPSLDETSVFALTRFYTKELSWFEHWGFMPQGF